MHFILFVFFLFSSLEAAWNGGFTSQGLPDCSEISTTGVCGCGLWAGINAKLYNYGAKVWGTLGGFRPLPVANNCSTNMLTCTSNTWGASGCCIQLYMSISPDRSQVVCSIPGNYPSDPARNGSIAHITPCTSMTGESTECWTDSRCIGYIHPGTVLSGFMRNNNIQSKCTASKRSVYRDSVLTPTLAFGHSTPTLSGDGQISASSLASDFIYNGWDLSATLDSSVSAITVSKFASYSITTAISQLAECSNDTLSIGLDFNGLPISYDPPESTPFAVPCVGKSQVFCPSDCNGNFLNSASLVKVGSQYAWICPPCNNGTFAKKRYMLIELEGEEDEDEDELN